MKVKSLSASAINSYDWCPHQFTLSYALNIKTSPGEAALFGSVYHSIMEVLARSKLEETWTDKILGEITPKIISYVDLHNLVDFTYSKYQEKNPQLSNKGLKKCHDWVDKSMHAGYDPRMKDIISTEKWFEIEIEGVQLRGVIDLVTRENESTYRILDYKTGSDYDFIKKVKKDYDYLNKDVQLRLYHYAAHQLFPEVEDVLISIYFVNLGKSFEFAFSREDTYKVELFIKKKLARLEQITVPKLNITPACKFCPFSTLPYGGQSACEFFRDKFRINGLEKTIEEYKVVRS